MLPYIDTPFEYASDVLGASVDELKLIFSFLASYPLAAVLKRIPDSKPYQKNAFVIAVSIFYLVGLFDLWDGIATLLITSVGAYAIAYWIEGPWMPWIAFMFLMGHMSISHLNRQFINKPQNVDISGAQMVLVMKLTAFCWNIADGKLSPDLLSDYQKEKALPQLPDLLDYAGYVLFFPSLMAGPAFDYADYRAYISCKMFSLPPGTDPSKAPPTRKKRKIPRSGTPAAKKAVAGLAWIFAFLKFSSLYYPDVVLSDAYMDYGFLRRVWLLHMLGFTTRMKYYGVWSLTEGACILSGIGYRGIDSKTGTPAWDRLTNVKPWGVELAQNTHAYLGNWNINTNHWLRNYVYLRVTPRGRKPGFRATLATFVTSAFWHGFYPGYYMSFVLASFMQTIGKNTRRFIRPLFLQAPIPSANQDPKSQPPPAPTPYKRYYDLASYVITQLAFSFTVAPFILLSCPDSWKVWTAVRLYAVLGTIAATAFFASPGRAYLIRLQKARVGHAADKAGEKKPQEMKPEEFASAQRPEMAHRAASHVRGAGPNPYGLPDVEDVDEIVDEVRREIQRRKRTGSIVGEVNPQQLRGMVEQKIWLKGQKKD